MNISEIHQLFLDSNGVCTDTRKLKKGELFIALKGGNFNGNEYALKAIENGALYAIVDDPKIEHPNCIQVKNGLETLQELAKFHRNYLKTPIIALTGSNGKTTTKELIVAVLSTQFNCVGTLGNLNNHIGVPLTLLSMSKTTEIGVVEMGANHMQEIAELCEIALPNYGYITNIGKAHLEGFGSEENILIGKTELYDYIKKSNGTVFCNTNDDKLATKARSLSSIFFTKDDTKENSLQIKLIKTSPFVSVSLNNTEIHSNLIGSYNYSNIAASITIGKHFNINNEAIKQAIENYIPKNNRSELLTKGTNDIILDAYNANPNSMEAALSNFISTKTQKKSKIAILGDMFELGDYALKEHQSIVDFVSDSELDQIFLCGTHFEECTINSDKISLFTKTESLILHLKKNPITNSLLLIKGSRGMGLEKTVPIFE